MYWFLLLFPLMIFPWGYDPYYTLPKTAYLQIFVLIGWLYVLIKRKYRSASLGSTDFRIEGLVSIFLALVVLSTVFSVNQMLSLYGTDKRYEGLLTFFSYCSIFLFSYRFLVGKQEKSVLPGMAIASILVSIYGILQHFKLDFLPRNSRKLNDDRSYAFFDNPNFYGSYLVLLIMITLTLYLGTENKKLMIVYFSILNLNFVALLFSETRSGWVGVFCGLVFLTIFLILKRKKLWKKWVSVLAAFALVIILMNLVEQGNYMDRMNTVFTDSYKVLVNKGSGHEGASRLFIWKESLTLLEDYFWLGSGPDTLEEVFPASEKEKEQFLGSTTRIVDKVHNEYLHMAVTIGVPALFAYLSILFLVLKYAFQAAKRKQGESEIYFYGLISVIFAYLVQAFFNISVVPVAPLFWGLLGLTLANAKRHLGASNTLPLEMRRNAS